MLCTKENMEELSKVEKNHMWNAVKECLYNSDIEAYNDATIKHMGSLWEKWRSKLNVDYVRPCKSREEAVRNVPEDMDPHDWEWLVNNKYLTAKFKEASDRNSINWSKAIKMPHHTGNKPNRELKCQKDEIRKTIQSNPSHTDLEIIEKCFGPQRHGHVFGYRGWNQEKAFRGV
ncbi:hypothetical protein Scep_023902 [Stephania cephalantha]|uniref:Uncharacterized protein n=1 Tax=Stephania cephalantha TaxID=152367 RepID=A0AAP0F100_9MAGN